MLSLDVSCLRDRLCRSSSSYQYAHWKDKVSRVLFRPATFQIYCRHHVFGSQQRQRCPSSRVATCRAISSRQEQSTSNYEFRDDKGHVELRLRLPEDMKPVSASEVFVKAYDTTLSVTFASSTKSLDLLPETRLYSRIKASDTVWFVDEEEIVISLQKIDKELEWPALSEDWESLKKGVLKLLKGCSVYIVGESTEINWEVAKALAEGLQYVPLQTQRILEEANKMSLEKLLEDEGADYVADAEAGTLLTCNPHVRLVVGTLGGGHGAASRKDRWNCLHAGIVIWLFLGRAEDETAAQEQARTAKEAGTTSYANAEAVVALNGWDDDSAQPVAEGCLRALKYILQSEKDLPAKKNLYIRLGCRGDLHDTGLINQIK